MDVSKEQNFQKLPLNDRFELIVNQLPKELNLFNLATLELTQTLIARPMEWAHFERSLLANHSYVFPMHGEWEGFIFSQIDQTQVKKLSPLEMDLYLETVNTVLGKFLTDLDQKHHVLATITYPKILKEWLQFHQGPHQFYKFLNKVKLFANESSIFHGFYQLEATNLHLPFQLTFIMRHRGSQHDWNNF